MIGAASRHQLDQIVARIRQKRGPGHRMVVASKCHPEALALATYADGILTLICQGEKCGHPFAWVKVAAS